MSSWIYVFSKFTPEALLFEALLICFLMASYAAFWVLRKRRLGAVDDAVPASVVKLYLNELIGEAHDMRTQLFGLLSGGNLPISNLNDATGPSFTVSGDAGEKLAALEKKMAEQGAAIEKIMAEKAKLEKELTVARAHGTSTGAAAEGGAGAAGGEALQKLQDKCQSLEARLAEYSVIEDDLANLKRLQQENAQLKSQLSNPSSGAGIGNSAPLAPQEAPAAAAPPAADASADASSATPAALASESSPSSESSSADAIAQAASAAAPALETPNTGSAFEGLVDEVEKSLQPSNLTPGASDAGAAASSVATPPAVEKTDEDLIAEFEKMLNS